jgi:hypothetical protein
VPSRFLTYVRQTLNCHILPSPAVPFSKETQILPQPSHAPINEGLEDLSSIINSVRLNLYRREHETKPGEKGSYYTCRANKSSVWPEGPSIETTAHYRFPIRTVAATGPAGDTIHGGLSPPLIVEEPAEDIEDGGAAVCDQDGGIPGIMIPLPLHLNPVFGKSMCMRNFLDASRTMYTNWLPRPV